MRTIPALSAFIAILASAAAAKDLLPYEDGRSGTATVVPADWRELPPDERWHGTRFVSPDGSSWLAVYAAPKTGSIEAHMNATTQVDRETITYLVGAARLAGRVRTQGRSHFLSQSDSGLRRYGLAPHRVGVSGALAADVRSPRERRFPVPGARRERLRLSAKGR